MAISPPGLPGMNLGPISDNIRLVMQAINNLSTVLATIFPTATSTVSHTATAGVDTLPPNPAGFITIMINGVAQKVPFYDV